MFRVAKTFKFCASHQLSGLPSGHKCGRLHGHNYRVEIVLQAASLDSRGFVVDFGDLSDVRNYIDENLDHRHLNNVVATPTAENVARHIFLVAKSMHAEVSSVTVWETDTCWAEYSE